MMQHIVNRMFVIYLHSYSKYNVLYIYIVSTMWYILIYNIIIYNIMECGIFQDSLKVLSQETTS